MATREPGFSSSSFRIRRQGRGGAAWVVATAFLLGFALMSLVYRWPDASLPEVIGWGVLMLLIVVAPMIWLKRRDAADNDSDC